jgi:asparagine N-glycosylation enzyme membrane subunit Stt3
MSKNPVHFLEVIWILVAIACFILGIKAAIGNHLTNSLIFFIFTGIAVTMYAFRRYIRKKNPPSKE